MEPRELLTPMALRMDDLVVSWRAVYAGAEESMHGFNRNLALEGIGISFQQDIGAERISYKNRNGTTNARSK